MNEKPAMISASGLPIPPWGQRIALPSRRPNSTTTAHVQGHGVHLTVDYSGSHPIAIAIEVHKEGSVFRGLMYAIADLVSGNLQRGAPVDEVVMMLRAVHLEPSGMVSGHPTITDCTSIVDLVGQMLAAEVTRVR